MLANNRWVRSTGTLSEKPISIQYREDWALAKEAGEYPVCVQIAWNADTLDDSTGFPSLAEQSEILFFHEQLQSHIEKDEQALIMMSISHDGVNQWVIYAQDLERFITALEQVPNKEGGYPIEVVADEDPEWNVFTQVYQVIESQP